MGFSVDQFKNGDDGAFPKNNTSFPYMDTSDHALLLQVVDAVVRLDAMDPGREGRPALEAGQAEVDLHEDFLGEVFGVGR